MELDIVNNEINADIVETVRDLIRIKSVQDNPVPGGPFGAGVLSCLEKTLDICNKMGFRTKNLDGYAGYAEWGEGEELIGILAHLDVVPEGTGWTYEPYAAEVVENKIYGRGTTDDKGPAVASIYALKALKDSKVKFNKRVRIIFGCNEESGWECMKHYIKVEEMPSCGFTPDGLFPIINREKGILSFNIEKQLFVECNNLIEGIKVNYIKGGERVNVVAEYCEAELEIDEKYEDIFCEKLKEIKDIYKANIEAERFDNKYIVKCHGVSAHACMPEQGINAIAQMFLFLNNLPLKKCDKSDYINFIAEKIGLEIDGTSLGINFKDDLSGALTFNIGIVDLNEKYVTTSINIRYPITYQKEDILGKTRQTIGDSGIEIIETEYKAPLYVPEDNFMIKKLQKVYEEETGEKAELISIGGGTYARAMKNCVAFGGHFPNRSLCGHQKDECLHIEDLYKMTNIYSKAILELVR